VKNLSFRDRLRWLVAELEIYADRSKVTEERFAYKDAAAALRRQIASNPSARRPRRAS
jgi:hypothetical protein